MFRKGQWCSSFYHRSESHVAAVDLGEAEVSQLHLALAGHKDILRFQVSVHHVVRVKKRQAGQQLPHQVLQEQARLLNWSKVALTLFKLR